MTSASFEDVDQTSNPESQNTTLNITVKRTVRRYIIAAKASSLLEKIDQRRQNEDSRLSILPSSCHIRFLRDGPLTACEVFVIGGG
jgi:hypothetical protein